MAQKSTASALRERARRDAGTKTEPDLSALRLEAERWRSLSEEKRDLEARLREANVKLSNAEFERLPALMDASGISSFTLAAEGNHPAVELTVRPYYHANIAADWDPKRRSAAFEALESSGAGDLIRTVVTVSLPPADHERLDKLLAGLKKARFDFEVRESVHFGTLTAWVKEQAEAAAESRRPISKFLPPLEVIGAKIGRICRPKIKEEIRG